MLVKKSFAKINLYLEIVGNDSKNYHLLDSLMAFIDIYDRIEISENDKLELIISGENSLSIKQNINENIIIKTINLFAKKFSLIPKIKISLIKNIPVAAGLGGGSSNASTIILMLNEFYNLNLSIEKLKEIGLEIGSDVPFFLHQKMALISGIGEKISEVKIKQEPLFVLLINPRKALSTKKIFELFSAKYKKNILVNSAKLIKTEIDIIESIKNRENHLEKVAIEIIPEVLEIIKVLGEQRGCLISRMSGSGATCFGLFRSQIDLDKAEINFHQNFPEFYIRKSKLIYQL